MTTNQPPAPPVKDIDHNDYFQLDTLLRAADIDIGDATTRDQGVALFVSITYSVRVSALLAAPPTTSTSSEVQPLPFATDPFLEPYD